MSEKSKEAIYDTKTLGTGKVLILGIRQLFSMFGVNQQGDKSVNFGSRANDEP